MIHPNSTTSKRRPNASSAPSNDPVLPTHYQPAYSSVKEVSLSDPRARRKRLFVYLFAFMTMLALSYLLDIRRASVRSRSAKVQLSLPSAPLASLSDGLSASASEEGGNTGASVAKENEENLESIPSLSVGAAAPTSSTSGATTESLDSVGDGVKKVVGDVNLSDQELKDDVDQLLAHVAEEEGANSNTTVPAPVVEKSSEEIVKEGVKEGVKGLANSILGVVGASSESSTDTAVKTGLNITGNSTEGTEVKLNSEDQFLESQKRMDVLLTDETVKVFTDENDLRTLQALALQATRGDCEHKSGAEKSLFKTDAEAASDVDIERTDPLWGAWCLFSGSYKTDAMRDYVTKQKVVEDKMMAAKTAQETNTTLLSGSFDANAASLDDVLTPEQQSALREKLDTISKHLHESDVRYLAALSLQATFGDCGPYGKETDTPSLRLDESAVELRKLREPLLDQAVVRKEGPQWGAWCVLQGKKRTLAATDLSQRVDLLIDQWTRSQSAVASAEIEETLGVDIENSDKTLEKTRDSIGLIGGGEEKPTVS